MLIRAWWRYAYVCVLRELQKRKSEELELKGEGRDHVKAGKGTISDSVSLDWSINRATRVLYEDLYTRVRLDNILEKIISTEEKAKTHKEEQLLVMEDRMNVEQILLYRTAARSAAISGSCRLRTVPWTEGQHSWEQQPQWNLAAAPGSLIGQSDLRLSSQPKGELRPDMSVLSKPNFLDNASLSRAHPILSRETRGDRATVTEAPELNRPNQGYDVPRRREETEAVAAAASGDGSRREESSVASMSCRLRRRRRTSIAALDIFPPPNVEPITAIERGSDTIAATSPEVAAGSWMVPLLGERADPPARPCKSLGAIPSDPQIPTTAPNSVSDSLPLNRPSTDLSMNRMRLALQRKVGDHVPHVAGVESLATLGEGTAYEGHLVGESMQHSAPKRSRFKSHSSATSLMGQPKTLGKSQIKSPERVTRWKAAASNATPTGSTTDASTSTSYEKQRDGNSSAVAFSVSISFKRLSFHLFSDCGDDAERGAIDSSSLWDQESDGLRDDISALTGISDDGDLHRAHSFHPSAHGSIDMLFGGMEGSYMLDDVLVAPPDNLVLYSDARCVHVSITWGGGHKDIPTGQEIIALFSVESILLKGCGQRHILSAGKGLENELFVKNGHPFQPIRAPGACCNSSFVMGSLMLEQNIATGMHVGRAGKLCCEISSVFVTAETHLLTEAAMIMSDRLGLYPSQTLPPFHYEAERRQMALRRVCGPEFHILAYTISFEGLDVLIPIALDVKGEGHSYNSSSPERTNEKAWPYPPGSAEWNNTEDKKDSSSPCNIDYLRLTVGNVWASSVHQSSELIFSGDIDDVPVGKSQRFVLCHIPVAPNQSDFLQQFFYGQSMTSGAKNCAPKDPQDGCNLLNADEVLNSFEPDRYLHTVRLLCPSSCYE